MQRVHLCAWLRAGLGRGTFGFECKSLNTKLRSFLHGSVLAVECWDSNNAPHLTFKLRVIVRTIPPSEQHDSCLLGCLYFFQSISERFEQAEGQI